MQKRRKVFIAINLPGDVKKHLAGFERKWPDLPAKWAPEENLHITLEFVGDLYDHEFSEAIERAKEIATNMKPFEVCLDYIGYAPKDKIPPRMLWAVGGDMHVTLARISAFAWRQIEPEERPQVGENVNLNFLVESIDVMESEGGKNGPHYTLIESVALL